MKTIDDRLVNFYWQDGYGAFSVNPSEVNVVKTYIENQHEHHNQMTFQDEYRAFLKKYQIEYDERYVWEWLYFALSGLVLTSVLLGHTGLCPVLVMAPFQG
jgi:hypothetical protein